MKTDLFHRYVWLVDVVRKGGKLTFEEISRRWLEADINIDGSPMVLRTFHNHREAIENLFGVRILCDRSNGSRYYVEDDDVDGVRLKTWMLQTLATSRQLNASLRGALAGRIQTDCVPEEKDGLATIIDAMKQNRVISMLYRGGDGQDEHIVLDPYSLRLTRHCWYLIGREHEGGRIRVYELGRMVRVDHEPKLFIYPEEFSADDFFDVDTSRCEAEVAG